MTKIIAVCGASGCGKTTLVKRLASYFNCPALHFDNFIDLNTYPSDMKKWAEAGCDVNRINTPRLKAVIEYCKKNNPESDYIFVEDPFGRCRYDYRDIYNTVILLDTPIDICFDRIITRATVRGDDKSSIDSYVQKYNEYFKQAYLTAVAKVKKDANLVVFNSNSQFNIDQLIGFFESNEL